MTVPKLFLLLGALTAAIAVAAGAFGSHALRTQLSADMWRAYQTAVQYQFFHALGLLAVGLTAAAYPVSALRLAGWLMLTGMVLFSGSLYLLAVVGVRKLGIVTPIGGLALLVAWLVFAVGIYQARV